MGKAGEGKDNRASHSDSVRNADCMCDQNDNRKRHQIFQMVLMGAQTTGSQALPFGQIVAIAQKAFAADLLAIGPIVNPRESKAEKGVENEKGKFDGHGNTFW